MYNLILSIRCSIKSSLFYLSHDSSFCYTTNERWDVRQALDKTLSADSVEPEQFLGTQKFARIFAYIIGCMH